MLIQYVAGRKGILGADSVASHMLGYCLDSWLRWDALREDLKQ